MSLDNNVRGWPPNLFTPTSNETLVLVDGFSYIEPIVIPSKGLNPSAISLSFFRLIAQLIISGKSSLKSSIAIKSFFS